MSVSSVVAKSDDQSLHLMQLINGFQVSQAIYVVVTLGVPDLLRDGPLPSDRLACLTRSHPGALYRVLRALAAVGIFHEDHRLWFALTPLGEGLLGDAAGSRSAWARFVARPPAWETWGQLIHSVRTGETGFQHVHGNTVWEFRANHPEESAAFDLAMREGSVRMARQILSAYDLEQFRHIVDVGGGDGALLAHILTGCEQACGTLFDQPHVVAKAGAVLEQVGVRARCSIISGSFFDEVPGGGDAYLLKHILHDWEDEKALSILRNCRRAMPSEAKLLVVERILAPHNEGAEAKFSDVNMLVNAGGQERTRGEFEALLAGAGFVVAAFQAWLTQDDGQQTLWPGYIRLTDVFFESLLEHAVPLQPEAVGQLQNSAFALDVYSWLAHRLCRVNEPEGVKLSWAALKGQFGQEYSDTKNFKRKFLGALEKATSVYKDARIEAVSGGLKLLPSLPPVKRTMVTVRSARSGTLLAPPAAPAPVAAVARAMNVNKLVSERALEQVPRLAPGRDKHFLAATYKSWVVEQKGAMPDKLDAAFLGWVKKFTKGKGPG